MSENAEFAQRCADFGVTFIGPRADVLAHFGDKVRARALAEAADVPVMPGTRGDGGTSLGAASEFRSTLGHGGAVMIKAAAGGDGRGTLVSSS